MLQKPGSKPEDGIDRITNLPDHILVVNILSKLETTEEVIRTSILSKRWRYLWTGIPSLDMVCCKRSNPPNELIRNKFIDFVYWVLVNRSQDLESFRLSCSNYHITSMIDRWINLAVMRKVKQLHLKFCPSPLEISKIVELPHSLVSCDSVEVLRLFLFRHALRLPRISGFETLRVLELNGVELSDGDLVQKFLLSCRLLEELSVIDCLISKLGCLCIQCPKLKTLRVDNDRLGYHNVHCCYKDDDYDDVSVYKVYNDKEGICGRLIVLCPNLVSLDYGGHIANHFSFDVQSLKKAVLKPCLFNHEAMSNTIFELFDAVSIVEYLSISYCYVIGCSDLVGVSLRNLKTVEITIDLSMTNEVISILKCSPNLESFHLIIQPEAIADDLEEFVDVLDEVETRRIITRHLKRVEFADFYVEEAALAAQLLLKHGNVIEEIVFTWRNEIQYNRKAMEVINQVSKFDKASSAVKLIAVLNTSIFPHT